MAKILLVEDDKSLREIYGVRLQAEGYEIVSAGDGEEALAMAIKEKPDLIVSDVMMPKISGFDMLDILRSTTETKNVKVIMMTALSSDDQRARGEALGADRYLVKSQVGIEDVVRTVHDVLADGIPAPAAAPSFPTTPSVAPAPVPAVTPGIVPETPVAPAVAPVADIPAPAPAPAPQPVQPVQPQPITQPAPAPVAPEPFIPATPQPVAAPVYNEIPVTPAAQPAAPVYEAPAPQPVQSAQPQPVAQPAPAPVADPFVQTAPQPFAPAPNPFAQPIEQPAQPVPASTLPQPTAPFSSPAPASLGERVIQPLINPDASAGSLDIAAQMEQALGTQPSPQGPGTPPLPPAA